jgi:putative transcriptional regulator
VKDKLFKELEASVKEGGKILRSKKRPSREFKFDKPDPKLIRENLGLSQIKFAKLLGISLATLQNWEQGRRKPDGPAKILLNVAAKHPSAVFDTVFNG